MVCTGRRSRRTRRLLQPGDLNLRGLGVAQDSARGLHLLEQAADAGSAQAALALYHEFTDGTYAAPDAASAAKWLERAADMGSAVAARLLMQKLDRGDPHTPPVDRVFALLLQCASRGDASAQASLALCYLEGKYVAKDENMSMQWFERAARAAMRLRKPVWAMY